MEQMQRPETEQTKRRVLILATLGTSDVRLDGERIRLTREEGEEILNSYDELSDRIDLPILRPCLNYIGAEGGPEVLDHQGEGPVVGLYYSDQDEDEAEPRERSKDTLFFAEIAKRKLHEMYPKSKKNKSLRLQKETNTAKDAVRLYYVPGSPSLYDRMYEFFKEFFGTGVDTEGPDISVAKEWRCYVLPTGGTPAMSSMMLLRAVQHFGASCIQLYTSRDETVTEITFGDHIARSSSRRQFEEALEVLQFRAAAKISDEAPQDSSGTSAAARYAEYRLAFDFRRAWKQCREARKLLPEGRLRRRLARHLTAIQKLGAVQRMDDEGVPHRDQPLLIAEIFYNLEVKYRNGEFVDVLGRCFRLQEALLRWTVEEYTGIRTGKGENFAGQQEAIAGVPGLETNLDSEDMLNSERQISKAHLYTVVRHLKTEDAKLSEEDRGRVERTVNIANKIDGLAQLRHKSVIAHGFKGVSEEDVIEAYKPDTPLIEDLREGVGVALGKDLSTNPFVELAEKLEL